MRKRLQVFISSTFTDLIEERQAAVSSILKNGDIPAGMELFTASDKSQWDIIKRWIDESDVYILILGGRYGSIESESGLSYTELEYNYALETNKPLFSIVIHDHALENKFKKFGSSVMEMDNRTLYTQFKDKVTSNMVCFFEDTKDIKLAVMESLPKLASERTLVGWISGADAPDTTQLTTELTKLNEENRKLRKEKETLESKLKRLSTHNDDDEFNDIDKDFSKIKLILPAADFEVPEDLEKDLLTMVIASKERLISGVTTGIGEHSSVRFILAHVVPTLVTYGLATYEKLASTTLRRVVITPKGLNYMRHLGKKYIVSKS
ncbi:Uncharacterised protein [Serratia proteamaculans]|uniref:DUF4062 domain-containing protein n=1 Tax=Serratia proteamaculans TaxID=28151 RepID=UPI0021791CD4|nr:DUF4062 domain-containing protein [Serratia proteamaculans]CAI0810986.1 Uncharacterised protein [Serratia proteamaculans]CAI1598270.1 Uncharacterised protein [Serratia proteamaculans]